MRRSTPTPHRVLIVGGGFGGLYAATRCRRASFAMSGAPIALCRLAPRRPRATLRLAAFHATLLRHSRGRADRRFGSRLRLLETVGRASGLTRHAAVVYLPDGDDVVVVPAAAVRAALKDLSRIARRTSPLPSRRTSP